MHPPGRTKIELVAALLPLLSGCSSPLETAIESVRGVRPDARLEGLKLMSWSELPPSRVDASEDLLSFPFVRAVIAAQSPMLTRIGVFTSGEHEELASRMAGDDATWASAFVLPARSLIVVRDAGARDVHLLRHEVGHCASHSMGYGRAAERFFSLDPGRPRDPAWIDLDAFLTAWAIEEGVAEVTARAAEQREARGSTDLVALAAGFDYGQTILERPTLAGPGTIYFKSRRFELKAGEEIVVQPDLEELLLELAYSGGQGCVLAHAPMEPLEAHFRATWEDSGRTTREIFRPGEPHACSNLAEACRRRWSTLEPRPVSATRVGAFLTFHVATARGEDPRAGLKLACALQDDLALRWEDGSALWIARFESEAAANEFAARVRARTDADVRVCVREVQVVAGAVAPDVIGSVADW